MNNQYKNSTEATDAPILDQFSDLYRVCPNPNCKKPHMVANRGRDYCSKKCADDHYNAKRRLMEQKKRMDAARILIEWEPSLFEEEESRAVVQKSYGTTTPPILSALEKGIAILQSLNIDSINGTIYHGDTLEAAGFDFCHYSSLLENPDAPEGVESRYAIYGNYQIWRIQEEEFLIKKINN